MPPYILRVTISVTAHCAKAAAIAHKGSREKEHKDLQTAGKELSRGGDGGRDIIIFVGVDERRLSTEKVGDQHRRERKRKGEIEINVEFGIILGEEFEERHQDASAEENDPADDEIEPFEKAIERGDFFVVPLHDGLVHAEGDGAAHAEFRHGEEAEDACIEGIEAVDVISDELYQKAPREQGRHEEQYAEHHGNDDVFETLLFIQNKTLGKHSGNDFFSRLFP